MKFSTVCSAISYKIFVTAILVLSGCGQSKKTDQWTPTPVLADGAVESVEVIINGNSILDGNIVAKAGGQIRISVKYLRSSKEKLRFDTVSAFVTKENSDNSKICSLKPCFLGDTSTERSTGARKSWTSRDEKKGVTGIPVTLNLPPGDYSVWFCGCSSPQTASELRLNQENPWAFRTVIQSCRLRLNGP